MVVYIGKTPYPATKKILKTPPRPLKLGSESPLGSEFLSQAQNSETLLKRLRIWLRISEPIAIGHL